MILLIDNYDSFAHNLARYFRQLRQEVQVIRNDAWSIGQIREQAPRAIVMSPGPGTPDDAGICLEVVRQFHATIPLLGVCLGHQAICQALGGQVVRVQPVHGRSSLLNHSGHPLFAGIESPLDAGRYHSLVVPPCGVPDGLQVIAETAEGMVMAVAGRNHPVIGVQFHPESILTGQGYRLLGNFLNLAGLPVGSSLVEHLTGQLREQTTPVAKSRQTKPHKTFCPATPHPWQVSSSHDS